MVLIFEAGGFLKINIQTAQWVRAACGKKSSDAQGNDAGKVTLASFDFASSRDQIHALQWNMTYGTRPAENPCSCSLPIYCLLALD